MPKDTSATPKTDVSVCIMPECNNTLLYYVGGKGHVCWFHLLELFPNHLIPDEILRTECVGGLPYKS